MMGDKPARNLNLVSGNSKPKVGIAWQGGGNHGAFSWGAARVLLAEFERQGIPVVGMVGASAGAKNAVYAGYGMSIGKPGHKAEMADMMMERLWFSVAMLAVPVRTGITLKNLSNPATAVPEILLGSSHMMRNVADTMAAMGDVFNIMSGRGNNSEKALLEAYAKVPAMEFSRLYQRHGMPTLPTLEEHPLQHLVQEHIDFAQLAKATGPKVIVNTTNLRTGGLNVYMGKSLTSEAVASSGTLPELFSALSIGDSKHWDGGFSANPPIQPLYDECPDMTDIILIRVTPQHMRMGGMPTDHAAMADRRMEVMLNAAVESELRWAQKHADDTGRQLNIHVVSVPEIWPYSMRSKTDFESTNWQFFKDLRNEGEKAAKLWLHNHGHDLGERSTYDHDYRVYGGRAVKRQARLENA